MILYDHRNVKFGRFVAKASNMGGSIEENITL